jgi:hypothetical protein
MRSQNMDYNRRDRISHVISARKGCPLARQGEGKYKTGLTDRIYERFGCDVCEVIILDSRQGLPDRLIVFSGGFWAFLEAKISATAKKQPNQPYYVEKFGRMCFAAFIYPENEEAVLNELEQAYQTHWATRIS